MFVVVEIRRAELNQKRILLEMQRNVLIEKRDRLMKERVFKLQENRCGKKYLASFII